MNLDDLKAELTQMQQSLATWQAQLEEAQSLMRRAQEQAAVAQRQIDVHSGHIERINMWLAKLEREATTPAPKEEADLPSRLIEAEE